MKILVVEDDQALGAFLRKGLMLEGHEATWIGDGGAVLSTAREEEPDLIVLDLGLPHKDGMEVLHELRECAAAPAVIVLTGRNDLEERIRCLNLGADDCLVKPFHLKELSARCRAVLRRRGQAVSSRLYHGPIAMDLLGRKVWREDQPVELTGKEFALLEYLVRRKGQCCSREILLRELWQVRTEAVTNVVDVYVNYLRKKLAAAGNGSDLILIETVRGAGYRMAPAASLANQVQRSAAA